MDREEGPPPRALALAGFDCGVGREGGKGGGDQGDEGRDHEEGPRGLAHSRPRNKSSCIGGNGI